MPERVAAAARKTMIVLGIIPMAVIFFATEAIPIGLTGILMPILAYFLRLLPMKTIRLVEDGFTPFEYKSLTSPFPEQPAIKQDNTNKLKCFIAISLNAALV